MNRELAPSTADELSQNLSFRELYDIFCELSDRFASIAEQDNDQDCETEADLVLDQQASIIQICSTKKAVLIQDAYLKLRIWRLWMGDEISADPNQRIPSESLILSVLEDLAQFFSEPSDMRMQKAQSSTGNNTIAS